MIRDATPDDADAIGLIHVTAWRETYPGIMPPAVLDRLDPVARAGGWRRRLSGDQRDAFIALVAEAEVDGQGEVVGFGSAAFDAGTGVGEIMTLYLLRRAQGRGLGGALFRALAARLAERGATTLELWMAAGNPTGGFYAHLGGVVAGRKVERLGDAREEIAEVRYRWHDISRIIIDQD